MGQYADAEQKRLDGVLQGSTEKFCSEQEGVVGPLPKVGPSTPHVPKVSREQNAQCSKNRCTATIYAIIRMLSLNTVGHKDWWSARVESPLLTSLRKQAFLAQPKL